MIMFLAAGPNSPVIRFKFIIDFFDNIFEKWRRLFDTFHHLLEGVGLIEVVINDAPSFVYSVAMAVLAVAIIMWVVNLF